MTAKNKGWENESLRHSEARRFGKASASPNAPKYSRNNKTSMLANALMKHGAVIKEIDAESWKTPASNYQLGSFGNASLTRKNEPAGVYLMEGVDGYWFYMHHKPIQVTGITRDGEEWMVDDPLHWFGMQRLAENSHGRVLCGGLGLGLVQHALAKNPDIDSIDVVDTDSDVIGLMKNNVPRSVKIHQGDYYEFIKEHAGEYDTIICDLFVRSGHGVGHTAEDMQNAFALTKLYNPRANVYVWGFNDPTVNPAVVDMPKEFFDMRRGLYA